jgi:hypothetical protein
VSAEGGLGLRHVALYGTAEAAQPWGRSQLRAHALLSERAQARVNARFHASLLRPSLTPPQSALASLRARGGGEAAALAGTLRWLAAVSDVFAAPLRPGDAAPLLAPDPDCGGAVPLVPARCLAPHDAGAAEREALGLPPRPLAAPECVT